MKKIQQIVLLLACVLLTMAVAVRRDGRILGYEIRLTKTEDAIKKDTITTLSDGTMVVNTTELGKDIFGYAGPIPLEIYLHDGKVMEVKALKHSETPEFFEEAAHLLSAWNGKTISDAQALQVDVVTGATYTSRAIIDNMHKGLDYAAHKAKRTTFLDRLDTSPKAIAALVVVLLAAIVPLFYKNKRYRLFQLLLNVVVLGFWCGTFLSYTLFVNGMSHGMNLWASLAAVTMLIVAFIYPLFGKKNHYCNHVCPLGSLQELAGKCSTKKWKMSPRAIKYLTRFRELLWGALMLLMLVSASYAWIDYELFTAFIFHTAPTTVLVLAAVFTLLSVFVPHPYCRFVCPTGTLFKIPQNSK